MTRKICSYNIYEYNFTTIFQSVCYLTTKNDIHATEIIILIYSTYF
jgi:hypothetical protein